jgi:hypothetical protein
LIRNFLIINLMLNKRFLSTVALTCLVLFFSVSLNAQDPPPPPSDPAGSGGNPPVGGGTPVGSGLVLLVALGMGYGYTKYVNANKGNNAK